MNPTIREVLSQKPAVTHTVSADAMVSEVTLLMEQEGVGSLVVMEGQTFVGLVNERDILVGVVNRGHDPGAKPVADVMRFRPPTVAPDVPVRDAMRLLQEHSCRHLPVLDKGRLVGLVSIGDLMRWTLLNMEDRIGYLMRTLEGPAAGETANA